MEEVNMTCGFCRYGGNHENCPGGVWSNNKIYICDCGCELSGKMKCVSCGYRHPEEVSAWYCVDKDSCNARIETSRNKIRDLKNSQNMKGN